MRIIITKDGLKELQNSNEWSSSNINKDDLCSNKGSSLLNIHSLRKSSSDFVPIYPKIIKIKQNTVKMSQELNHLYSNNLDAMEPQPSIVIQVPDVLMSMQSSHSSSSLPKLKESYSLKEIIPQACFDKLEKKIKERQDYLYHHTKLDEKMLRNDEMEKRQKILKKIAHNKETTIDCKNIKLMEYLTGKTTITDQFLHNLASCDNERVNHLNKICQKIISRKENEQLYLKELKERKSNQRIFEQVQAYKDSVILEQKIDLSLKMIDKYSTISTDIRNNYKKLHNRFVNRYWYKNKFDRFYFPHSPRKNR